MIQSLPSLLAERFNWVRPRFRSCFRHPWLIPIIGYSLGLFGAFLSRWFFNNVPNSKLLIAIASLFQIEVWFISYIAWRSIRTEHWSGRAGQVAVTPIKSRDLFVTYIIPVATYNAAILAFALTLQTTVLVHWSMRPLNIHSLWTYRDFLPSWGLILSAMKIGFALPLFVYAHMILFPVSRSSFSAIAVPAVVYFGMRHLISVAQHGLIYWSIYDMNWRPPLGPFQLFTLTDLTFHLLILAALALWVAPRFKSIFDPVQENNS